MRELENSNQSGIEQRTSQAQSSSSTSNQKPDQAAGIRFMRELFEEQAKNL